MKQNELQEMIADTLTFLQLHESELDSTEQRAVNELLDDLDVDLRQHDLAALNWGL